MTFECPTKSDSQRLVGRDCMRCTRPCVKEMGIHDVVEISGMLAWMRVVVTVALMPVRGKRRRCERHCGRLMRRATR